MADEKLNLRQKLLAVMADVGNVPKAGQNTQGAGYKYQMVKDMYPKVQKALIDHGIAFLSSEKGKVWLEPRENRNGTLVHTCHVDMEFTLLDTESDEKLVAMHGGEAFDTSDKALNKAKTAALKYFLKQTLLIAEEDEDTEKDTHEIKRTRQNKKGDDREGHLSPSDIPVEQETKGTRNSADITNVALEVHQTFPDARRVTYISSEQVDELYGLCLDLAKKVPDRARVIFDKAGVSMEKVVGGDPIEDDAFIKELTLTVPADYERRISWLQAELEKVK